MNALQDQRVLAAVGAGAALLAGVLIAMFLMGRDKTPGEGPPAGTKGGLQVEMGEVARLDPARPLRCFVGGQFVGLATLVDCARRNGVSAQSMDVGLDESGELAAGGDMAALQPLPVITPPTQVAVSAPPSLPPLDPAPPVNVGASGPVGECMRYGADGWRSLGGAMSQNACVQLLFDGRCQRAGEALYGRWSSQTLRLVPGRVETSPDNRAFSTLVEQGANCALPAL
jgi:hypothetical protein